MPFRGFFPVGPPEYRSLGCVPAEQFVPQLMEHLGLAYYVGLRSAATLHGAAHQAPMVFQTVVAANRAEIRCGRVRVQVIARSNVADIPTERRNTMRGVLRLSSPEATAFDLVGYHQHSGGLSNVATILSELAEKLDARRLVVGSVLDAIRRVLDPWLGTPKRHERHGCHERHRAFARHSHGSCLTCRARGSGTASRRE